MPRKKKAHNPGQEPSKAVPRTPVSQITADQQIIGAVFLGKVLDYYSHAGVITLVLEAALSAGDTIRIKGHTTDLSQKVEHMEIDRHSVQSAAPGDGVGIKLADKARIGDAVYKI